MSARVIFQDIFLTPGSFSCVAYFVAAALQRGMKSFSRAADTDKKLVRRLRVEGVSY